MAEKISRKNNVPEYIKKNDKLIHSLEKKTYFAFILDVYNYKLAQIKAELVLKGLSDEEAKAQAEQKMFSRLCEVMKEAQSEVEAAIYSRKESGKISNVEQARKSVAGNLFQQVFAYCLAKNVVNGNIKSHVVVSLSTADIVDQYASIKIGNNTLKPDSDVVVYSEEDENSPVVNFSCKTSCRERIGQTNTWKLLCDLATCDCEHKNGNEKCIITKCKLSYKPKKKIVVCFVTADFYNELSNPQVNGMCSLFDNVYVAKTTSPSFNIDVLENVVKNIDMLYNK